MRGYLGDDDLLVPGLETGEASGHALFRLELVSPVVPHEPEGTGGLLDRGTASTRDDGLIVRGQLRPHIGLTPEVRTIEQDADPLADVGLGAVDALDRVGLVPVGQECVELSRVLEGDHGLMAELLDHLDRARCRTCQVLDQAGDVRTGVDTMTDLDDEHG